MPDDRPKSSNVRGYYDLTAKGNEKHQRKIRELSQRMGSSTQAISSYLTNEGQDIAPGFPQMGMHVEDMFLPFLEAPTYQVKFDDTMYHFVGLKDQEQIAKAKERYNYASDLNKTAGKSGRLGGPHGLKPFKRSRSTAFSIKPENLNPEELLND